jgi:hypothetical protein
MPFAVMSVCIYLKEILTPVISEQQRHSGFFPDKTRREVEEEGGGRRRNFYCETKVGV